MFLIDIIKTIIISSIVIASLLLLPILGAVAGLILLIAFVYLMVRAERKYNENI